MLGWLRPGQIPEGASSPYLWSRREQSEGGPRRGEGGGAGVSLILAPRPVTDSATGPASGRRGCRETGQEMWWSGPLEDTQSLQIKCLLPMCLVMLLLLSSQPAFWDVNQELMYILWVILIIALEQLGVTC